MTLSRSSSHGRGIALIAFDDAQAERIARALDGAFEVHRSATWLPAGALQGVDTVLVQVEWLDQRNALAEIAALVAEQSPTPVVLVTSSHPENTRRLKDLRVAEVVWVEEISSIPSKIRRTLYGAAGTATLLRLGERVRRATGLPGDLAEALYLILTSPRPPRSVKDVARWIGRDPSTLHRQWNRVVADEQSFKDFLYRIQLIHAVERKTLARSWEDVAWSLDVDRRTLGTAARRTGWSLGDLGPAALPDLLARVEATLEEINPEPGQDVNNGG